MKKRFLGALLAAAVAAGALFAIPAPCARCRHHAADPGFQGCRRSGCEDGTTPLGRTIYETWVAPCK